MKKIFFRTLTSLLFLSACNEASATVCTKKICTTKQDLQLVDEEIYNGEIENRTICNEVEIKGYQWMPYYQKCGFTEKRGPRFGRFKVIERMCQEWQSNTLVNTYFDEIRKWTGQCSDERPWDWDGL